MAGEMLMKNLRKIIVMLKEMNTMLYITSFFIDNQKFQQMMNETHFILYKKCYCQKLLKTNALRVFAHEAKL